MDYRNFQMLDTDACQLARVFQKHYTNNIIDFTAFDAIFNAAFGTNMTNAATAAENQQSDETTLDQITQLTAAMNVATENCMKAIFDLRYYAEKAFGKSSAIYKSFSLNRAWKVSHNTPQFIVYMKVNHKLAAANQTALIAQGMTAPKIANILTVATALDTAEQNQELGKRQRISMTATRIDTYNTMWAFVTKLNDAARVIYQSNPEKLALFRIPYKKRKKKKEDE